ncbi:TPA: hypothetical protein RQK14_003664 [Vibrio vulnificus]|nr:hypothetical protein [Vibrio vulnificus]
MFKKTKKTLIQGAIFGLFVTSLSGQASGLSKDDLLRAASLKNEQSGQIAQTTVQYLDQICKEFEGEQTRSYLDSDYHATLVALHAILPKIYFDSLHQNSLRYAHCDTFSDALSYIHTQLGIK